MREVRPVIGPSHTKIAELVALHVARPWQTLLGRYWHAVEVGLEVPDRFMIWHRDPGPPASAGTVPSKLVHRQFLDARDEAQGELISMILMYTEGIEAFARALADDGSMRDQTQDLILYTGALLHFLADLCTPLHVGCSLDENLRAQLGDRFHQKIEARLWRHQQAAVAGAPEHLDGCALSESWLRGVAATTYEDYQALPDVLRDRRGDEFRERASAQQGLPELS